MNAQAKKKLINEFNKSREDWEDFWPRKIDEVLESKIKEIEKEKIKNKNKIVDDFFNQGLDKAIRILKK